MVATSIEKSGTQGLQGAKGIVTAIDVGTTKVCTLVGRSSGADGIRVLAYSSVPCQGLRKGNVTDVAATQRAVRRSIEDVEQATGYHIESAFVGVTGSHVSFENRRDELETRRDGGAITWDELHSHGNAIGGSVDEPGRRLIHAIKMSYLVDGESGIRNPVGMHSREVEVETHLVTGGLDFINKLVRAVEGAGVKVAGLVLEPLASAMAVLTPEEKENGAVLVDIGGGTTDVVVFRRGHIFYSGVIPVGGYQFTNDIAVTFNTPYDAAEAVKIKYANTDLQAADATEEISLPVAGQEVDLKIRRMELSQLTRERGQELARLVKLKLDGVHLTEPAVSRLVLTGGASNMPGLTGLMERSLTLPARRGLPTFRGILPEELNDPSYATGLGILLWAETEHVPDRDERDGNGNRVAEAGPRGLIDGFLDRFSRMRPVNLFSFRKGGSDGG